MEAGRSRRRRRLDAEHESPTLLHAMRQGDPGFDGGWGWTGGRNRLVEAVGFRRDRARFFVSLLDGLSAARSV